ncbi:MAG TPA: glycosyltransferase family 2 protein [Gemmatimonadales bacterium]|nr:glycosyltransferase family 2 protein [Gemmatimonadales bacterium]
MAPRVSVVIPTYNRSHTLVRALESVFAQSEPVLEIIVVDDGSTDDTQAVLRKFGDRVRPILKSNGGAGAARNAGIEAARGEFVAFLDDDDAWLTDKVREQVRILDAHPRVGLTSTGAVFLDQDQRLDYVQSWSVEGEAFDRVLYHNPVVTSSVMARRSCLVELPSLFRKDLAPVEDWELWIRLCARHEVMVVSRPLVRYYATPASAFRKTGVERSQDIYRRMYEGLLLDPVVEPRIRPQWRRVLANIHFLAGVRHYSRGEGLRARGQLILSVLKSPWKVRWRTVGTMLLLPVSVRSWIRRRFTRRRAPEVRP